MYLYRVNLSSNWSSHALTSYMPSRPPMGVEKTVSRTREMTSMMKGHVICSDFSLVFLFVFTEQLSTLLWNLSVYTHL